MGESKKSWGPQPPPNPHKREEIENRLPPPLNRQIWRVVGVKPGSLVVENVTLVQGWSPIQDPALLRAETVIYRLIEFANVHAVHESRHRDEPRTNIVVDSLVRKVQP